MARIFTTRFVFNHQRYDAIVTIVTSDGQLNFNVKVLDLQLQDLLPGGHIRYQGKEGIHGIETENKLSQALVESIAASIEDYLMEKP